MSILENSEVNIKLRGSGQIINLARMPDSIVDIIYSSYAEAEDPLTILASWAYMFCGLSIDEIRDRFIVSDNGKARRVSREFIRQKIKSVYESIHYNYNDKYGDITLTTTYHEHNTHSYEGVFEYSDVKIFNEGHSDDYSQKEEIPETPGKQSKTKIQVCEEEDREDRFNY
jgi:hypothetical protein